MASINHLQQINNLTEEVLNSIITVSLDPNSKQRLIWMKEDESGSNNVLQIDEFPIEAPVIEFTKLELMARTDVVYGKLSEMLALVEMDSRRRRDSIIRKIIRKAREVLLSDPDKSLSTITVELYVSYCLEPPSCERDSCGMVPASKSAIAALKRGRLGELAKIRYFNFENFMCTICMKQIEVESRVISMPCSHLFHSRCIKKWLKVSHYCPVCRFELGCA